ncbi:hydroxymethylglutaryl-CoA lyase [Agriterribacter sp.]|mgnify:CR=1 FL=1|uniref:hydroxymethylglutaryl-CoA lyase n=2 Tax=Agriterribacter sp. TaxID=2821509 RepID=UPI002CF14DE7|nr:hydroxymethylglutaryl-CoA lyase [Agriterribacter sp.]HRO47351.1 hydroxymethylglutaryl-CoA lyase [Agriterribacter sp.]
MTAASYTVKLIECPRDAMQGWSHFIPTPKKIDYINALLKVGFDTIDFGSFVSPKAIPQMADTAAVVSQLDISGTSTKLLAIVANERGAKEALQYDAISCLGFPFSVSETFQLRNTNSTIAESLTRVEAIQQLCIAHKKQLVIYLSMGFGNPYGDPYNEEIVYKWAHTIQQLGVTVISLADTVGLATPEQVNRVTAHLISALPGIEIGVHLHSTPVHHAHKIDAAFKAGCRRFDGALLGIGGCPMADDELVGNMDTEQMISYFSKQGCCNQLNAEALQQSIMMAQTIFM